MVQRTKNQNELAQGLWNADCDRCGFKFKSSDLRKETRGLGANLYVCRDCYDPPHTGDFLRGFKDDPSVPWVRKEGLGAETYTDVNGDEQINNSRGCGPSSVPNQAVPNCLVPNNNEGYTNPL